MKEQAKIRVYCPLKFFFSGILMSLCLCPFFSTGQNPTVDSLRAVVERSSGVARHDALVVLTRAYARSDNEKALEAAMEASELAYQLGDTSKIITSLRMQGQLFIRLERSIDAEKILLTALALSERNTSFRTEYKNILSLLGSAYTLQAKYDLALDMNLKTLILREDDGDDEEVGVSLNNIGLIYFKLRNYSKAMEYYYRCKAHLEKTDNIVFLDRLLANIGLCYNQMMDYSKAQQAFDSAFAICGDRCGEQIKMEGNFGLGVSFFQRQNYDISEKHFQTSISWARKLNNNRFLAENLIFVAKIELVRGNFEQAVSGLLEAERLSFDYGYNEILIDCYSSLARIYKTLDDHKNALHYQSEYITLKDSIYSQDLIKNLVAVQTNFEERQNLATIAQKEDIIRRQRALNVAIIVIAVLAAALVFVLFRSNRVKRKVNLALSEAKAIIEDQNRQLLSSNYHLNLELHDKNQELLRANESLVRVNEELDNFIYKTSHDIRGPLASLKGMCNVALMDVHDPVALSYLQKLDITAEKLNTILTRLLIVNQINNSVLGHERIDFEGIVNDVLNLETKKGLPPRLKVYCHIDNRIVYHSDKQFVRIILENLIDNAIKFYNDSDRIDPFVDISVLEDNNRVRIRVVDNGIGISEAHPDKIFQMFSRASERSETGGIGLYITKTAAEKLGGSVNLTTTREGHTEFFVLLPLEPVRVVA